MSLKGATEMMGALSAWRRTVRPTAVVVAAAAAAVVLASSAAAATQVSHRHKATGRSLQTLFSSVRVFTSASDRGAVKGKLARPGTGVSVLCWTTGAYYKDTTVWYEISAPLSGYVSAFSLNAHYAPAVGMPHCLAPAFRKGFNALEANLKIRTAPSTTAAIAGVLGGAGSKVRIDCYIKGAPVFQDSVWYHAASPATGYVAGRLLNSGGDPAPGVPRC
jgi:hypothetical protein